MLQGPNDVVQPFDVALVSTTSDVDIQVLSVLCVPCVLYTGTVSVRIAFQGIVMSNDGFFEKIMRAYVKRLV